MTRTGIITNLYSQHVESRPFSRFTQVGEEQDANYDWLSRALLWGFEHVDQHGNLRSAVFVNAKGETVYVSVAGDTE